MRTIKLTEEEVNTLFGAIFQQTSNLEERLKDAEGSVAQYIRGQIKDLDNISKRIMHAGLGPVMEKEVENDLF
jgi:hypothetical protein